MPLRASRRDISRSQPSIIGAIIVSRPFVLRRAMARAAKAMKGWDHWTEVVGLRADEPHRVPRLLGAARADDHRAAGEIAWRSGAAAQDDTSVTAFIDEAKWDAMLVHAVQTVMQGVFAYPDRKSVV